MFILNIRADEYCALDPSRTEMWHRLQNHPGDMALDDDARGFLNELKDMGIGPVACETGQPDPQQSALTTASRRLSPFQRALRHSPFLAALYLLNAAPVRLGRGGLEQQYHSIRGFAGNRPQNPRSSLEASINAFRSAETFFLSKRGASDCLPRSLALFEFLTLYSGHAAKFLIGVKRYPFAAHAWVEAGDAPIFYKKQMIAEFNPLLCVEA